MPIARCYVTIPCHSLEDFPLHLEGEAADGLLAAWTSLWHPGLLAATGRLPTWCRADSPVDQVAGQLFVVPSASESMLPAGWAMRTQHEGGHVVRRIAGQGEIAAAALALAQLSPLATDPPSDPGAAPSDGPPSPVDPDLVADFHALGFAYLQLELLTRQMRYLSGVDEIHLERKAVEGARAVLAGQSEQARQCLTDCFETLLASRERFYPAEAYLFDLTLLAETTLGPDLAAELEQPGRKNLLLTGEVLSRLASTQPVNLAALRQKLEASEVSLVGGHQRETELPLESLEAIQSDLATGHDTFQTLLGRRPRVYGRRRFGLCPLLPQLLYKFHYHGALHFTLDDGQFPRGDQSKSRWEGLDGSSLEVLARLPLDARAASSFLSFPLKMSESMDMDHVAVVVLAHWPSRSSIWYDALRRTARYAPVLGQFITADEFFDHTTSPGRLSQFSADQYRLPYLVQDVAAGQPGPISRWAFSYQDESLRRSAEACRVWSELLTGRREPDASMASEAGADPEGIRRSAVQRLATALGCRPAEAGATAAGVLLVNPTAQPRPGSVPGFGFAWKPLAGQGDAGVTVRADERRLFNRFLELVVSEQSGGIQSLHVRSVRGNLCSQQLALRLPARGTIQGASATPPAEYSRMVADAVQARTDPPGVGRLISRGRLLADNDEVLARFEQTVSLATDSRVAEIEVQLELLTELRSDPWSSYLACRWAWSQDEAELSRSLGGCWVPTRVRRPESPEGIAVQLAKARVGLFTRGLPYHQRSGERMLDTLLVVRGETQRRFRLALAVGATAEQTPDASELALSLLAAELAEPPATPSGWLFHLDRPGLQITSWQTVWESGRPVGLRIRLLESLGRACRTRLQAFRPIGEARSIDAEGNTLAELLLEEGGVVVHLGRYEWLSVECRWA